jgi:hypothetical protein
VPMILVIPTTRSKMKLKQELKGLGRVGIGVRQNIQAGGIKASTSRPTVLVSLRFCCVQDRCVVAGAFSDAHPGIYAQRESETRIENGVQPIPWCDRG